MLVRGRGLRLGFLFAIVVCLAVVCLRVAFLKQAECIFYQGVIARVAAAGKLPFDKLVKR